MSFQDVLARMRAGGQSKQGDQQNEFLRQLGFMATYNRQPDPVTARMRRQPTAPDPAEADKMAMAMEEAKVREHFLRTKLGQKTTGPAPVNPAGMMQMGMEQFRQMASRAPAWLADNPDALTAFQQLEEQRLAAAQDPAIQVTDEIMRVASRNPDLAKELLARNDPNRGAAVQQQAMETAKTVAETALQKYIRENAYTSGTGMRRSMATGQLGGFGKVLSRVLDSDPRLRKITDGDEVVRHGVLQAPDILRRDGISRLDDVIEGEKVRGWNFASPNDRQSFVEGVRNFGQRFTANGRTLEFGLAGQNPSEVEGVKGLFQILQGRKPYDPDSQLAQQIADASGGIPPDLFAKQKGAWEYVVSKLTNTSEPEDLNEYGRRIGDAALKELERRDVFIADVTQASEDPTKAEVFHISKRDQWMPRYLKQETKSTGLYKGQPAIGPSLRANAGQIEQIKEILQRGWEAGAGQHGKKIEPWVRDTLRLMNVPENEIESRVQRAMPEFWETWMGGGYGQLDMPFDQLISQVVAPAFQQFLQDPNDPVEARPAPSGMDRGMEQLRETYQEMGAMEKAFGMGQNLPMGQDRPMDPTKITDHAPE